MAKGNTKFVQVRGFIRWAKVFEDNRDMESTDPQISKQLKKWEGQYKVDFIPADEGEKQKLLNAGLSLVLYGGGQRFKPVENSPGIPESVTFKRKHKDPSGIDEFGGAPEIVWWQEDRRGVAWDRETDGNIGNDSEVVLKVSIYGEGTGQTVRLYKIGVIDQKVWEGNENQGERF